MPTIKLTGDDAIDSDRLWAIMLYPENRRKQDQYVAVHVARFHLHIAEEEGLPGNAQIGVSHDILRILTEAPPWRDLEAESDQRFKRATLAGQVLLALYLMDRWSITSEPSIKKAIFATGSYARENTYGDGSRMNASPKSLRDALAEFNSVAHLCAALQLNQSTLTRLQDRETFLRVAADVLAFGTSFRAPRNPVSPLIAGQSAWAIPEPFVSSPLQPPRPRNIQSSPLWQVIAQYRAASNR